MSDLLYLCLGIFFLQDIRSRVVELVENAIHLRHGGMRRDGPRQTLDGCHACKAKHTCQK